MTGDWPVFGKYNKEEIAIRYRNERLPNVKRLVSNPPDLKLPNEAFDVVLMVMSYHHIY